jgi:glutamyl-tRNA synthetase
MLHPGGARTALFDYLFVRHYGGALILRVEDSDRARSEGRFERALLEDLHWLGLSFDEGPYRQSERAELYESAVRRLSGEGMTYRATDEAGRSALFFHPPARGGRFRDELRGEVSFGGVEDFVILKSDGTPSYNFAAVVDDLEMGITHVIRGEEHLPNTARQALLYRALAEDEPAFVHLGLILGPDGKKLSKRGGAASVAELRRAGYLPEAVVNYLALLGWTHPEGREEFAGLEELVREWDPARLGASPAIFDARRLLSLNARAIRRLPAGELRRRLESFLERSLPRGRELLAVEALREEMELLSDAPRLLEELVAPVEPVDFIEDLPEGSVEVYARAAEALDGRALGNLDDARVLVGELRAWAKEEDLGVREVLHPLRLALSGKSRGPEMAYLFAVLGPEESRLRLVRAREARLRL